MDRPNDGIGASDAAAILGIDRWHTALDVYNRVKGIVDPNADNREHLQWGNLLEPPIAARYTLVTGRRLRKVGLVRHPKIPWLYAHPDRLVVGQPGLVEIKVADRFDDDIPIYYRTQAIHQLIVTGREWVDFAVLEHGRRFKQPIPRYARDRAIEADFIAELESFWRDHVLADVPPPMDGGHGGRQYLNKMYPRAAATSMVATAEMLPLIQRYKLARLNRKQIEQAEEEAAQQIQALMGDAHHLIHPGGRFTWSRFPVKKVNWRAIAEGVRPLLPDIDWDTLISIQTNTVQSHRFSAEWKEEDDRAE